MFDEFKNYLKYMFGLDYTIEKVDDSEYLINNRWSFEWHIGFEKQDKRIVDLECHVQPIVIPYDKWFKFEPSNNRCIVQYDQYGRFVMVHDRMKDIIDRLDYDVDNIFSAMRKNTHSYNSIWRYADSIESIEYKIEPIHLFYKIPRELLYDLYVNKHLTLKQIVCVLQNHNITINIPRLRLFLLKHSIIPRGAAGYGYEYFYGKRIRVKNRKKKK